MPAPPESQDVVGAVGTPLGGMPADNDPIKPQITIQPVSDVYGVKDERLTTIHFVTGGTGDYVASLYQGTLPAGLYLSGTKLKGIPTEQISRNVTIRVTDPSGRIATSNTFRIQINAAVAVSDTAAVIVQAVKDTAYSYALLTTAGRSPLRWTIASGSLPTGLTLAAATGIISGTPTVEESQALTFTVTDSNSKTATTASITINVSTVVVSTAGIVTTTASMTADSRMALILCDCTGGAITITLPAVTDGAAYRVKKIDSSGNAVTIDGSGAETIDDSATLALSSQYNAAYLIGDATEWWIASV